MNERTNKQETNKKQMAFIHSDIVSYELINSFVTINYKLSLFMQYLFTLLPKHNIDHILVSWYENHEF